MKQNYRNKKDFRQLSGLIPAAVLAVLGCTVLLFYGYLQPAEESTPVYGTIGTAMQAAEADGVLYFLSSGSIYDQDAIASYDTASQTYRRIVELDRTIYGLQVGENCLYYLTGSGLYTCTLHGEDTELLAASSEDAVNVWFFLDGDTIYLGRSTMGAGYADSDAPLMRIYSLSISRKGAEPELVAAFDNLHYYQPSMLCYADGLLYGRRSYGIWSLNLSEGTDEQVVDSGENFLGQMYTTADGVLYEDEEEDCLYTLSGDVYAAEAPTGDLCGCSGEAVYYRSRDYRNSTFILTGLTAAGAETVYSGADWDMVLDIYAFSAGDYLLFYSAEDLGGEQLAPAAGPQTGIREHYLYLTDGTQLIKITSFWQESAYV